MTQKLYTYQQWLKIYKAKEKKKADKKATKAHRRIHAPIKTWSLYALELEDGKYYVGMTTSKGAVRRFEQHKSGIGGARWTKLHKPLSIIEVRELGVTKELIAAQMENDMTIEYMDKYGFANVRGGGMCCVRASSNIGAYNTYTRVKTIVPVDPNYFPKAERKDENYQRELAASLSWIQE